MQRYKDIPLIFTTTPEFLQTSTVDVEIPANTELEHKPNSGQGRKRESKKRKKKLNNFCVSHSFMNHSSRGQRKNLFRQHRDYFIYEWENYWDTDTGDLTPSQISWRYRSNLFDNFIGRLPARRHPTHAQRLCFQMWFVCFQTLLVLTMCLILFTTSARLAAGCVTN